MEGDGEGLVAIVQGLENAVVSLTVCNRTRLSTARSRPSGQRIQINAVTRSDTPGADQRQNMMPAVVAPPVISTAPAVQRASVETSTGTDFSKMATASQICDGRYASSYKLAHCMVTPTSPPVAVTEFPPQRKEPCRNQGNFEIGGHSRAQCSGHAVGHNVSSHRTVPVKVSTSRVRHHGGSQTWCDKGSNHRYSKSNHRETEAFAHSLRKYPSMAPFRTASTELIEKLIRYTQAKNCQNISRSTKSMRSLRHQKSSETCETVRASKHQQTYTRTQHDNIGTTSNVQVGYTGRSGNFKLYSPVSDSRHLRGNGYKDTFNSSYDYLKAGNPHHGRCNRSDGSPSPTYGRSPQRSRSPDPSCSPERVRSPDGSRHIRSNRSSKPLGFERSVRALSLSEMSRYIRSTIRQICNERPVVVQVCPKLKDRFNQHRKVCPNKSQRSVDVMGFQEEEENPEHQASGSVFSRFLQTFSGRPVPSTEQASCQCTRTDCYCTKGTQCVNNPDATTNTTTCSCTTANIGCCRGMPCICAKKSQDQAYYNKRIDEEISDWLKNVPVHSIEDPDDKKETIIKELRKTLKQLPDDENFEENAGNEIQVFLDVFPLWNPGRDEDDEQFFKNQLADELTEKIVAIPRKPDSFRYIVKKWMANMDFEDDDEELDVEAIIDNFVNKLKTLAADRPACDVKYTNMLRKEIIELLVELALKFDGDVTMLKKKANKFAMEIVSIPRNVRLSGQPSDLTSEFEENISDWICEHGLCEELKRNPKLIEDLAKKLNQLKSHGIYDEHVTEKMKEEVQQFGDDMGLAFETIDELIDELMKQISSTIQLKEKERLDQEELNEVVSDWLRHLPGAIDLHPQKLEKITKDLVQKIQESNEQENKNLANDMVDYLVNTKLSIDFADLGVYVEELMEKLNILPSDEYYKEQAIRVMLKDICDIIKNVPIPEEKKKVMRCRAQLIVESNLRKSSFNLKHTPNSEKETLLQDMDDIVSDVDMPKESQLQLKRVLSSSINKHFDNWFTRLSREQSDLKQVIAKDVKNTVKELPIDKNKKEDLMQQDKKTLSKNMNKRLPSNVEDNIHDEIRNVVEKCPICEDRNILSRIKKVLSEIASKHLTIYLPRCVCDIQNEVKKDVSIVIDNSLIDTAKKRELKKTVQDILTENEDRRLSDEVIETIKEEIYSVVSDLSITCDKEEDLKKSVGETLSKDFNKAGKAFKHDLDKIRNKLLDDITSVIEKSPIQRDIKSHLNDKLTTIVSKKIDPSLSDEKKYTILDEVSNILRNDFPEDKHISLSNNLAKTLDTNQKREQSEGISEIIKILSLDAGVQDGIKKGIKAIFLETLYNDLSDDVRQKIEEDISNAINEMNIAELDKENLKSNIAHAIKKELNKLLTQDKEAPEIKLTLEKIITSEIKSSPISKDNQHSLENKLKVALTNNLVKAVTDKVKDTIREKIEDMVDDIIKDTVKADVIKSQLLKVVDKDLNKSDQTKGKSRGRKESRESLRDQEYPKDLKEKKDTLDIILQEMERVVDEAPILREQKLELKKKLKNIAIKNLEKPLLTVNLPKDKKTKLKSELIAAVDQNVSDLQEETKYMDTKYPNNNKQLSLGDKTKKNRKILVPIEEGYENKVKDGVFQGIEEIIEESTVPKNKSIELKRKLKNMIAGNLREQNTFSDDLQTNIENGIADIIDELPISKHEKNKLKNALTSTITKNIDLIRGGCKLPVAQLKELEDDPIHNYIQQIERSLAEASIPRKKKNELKKKLRDLYTKSFNKIPLEDVTEALDNYIIEITNDLNLPKDIKNKLRGELIATVDEYTSRLQATRKDKKLKPSIDSRYNKSGKGPIEDINATKVDEKVEILRSLPPDKVRNLKEIEDLRLDNIIREMERTLGEASRPRQKIIESKKLNEIVDDLDLKNSKKSRFNTTYADTTDKKGLKTKEVDETKVKDGIFQGIEKMIDESAVSKRQKMNLKDQLKTLAAENLKKPFSKDVQDNMRNGIADIIDDQPITQSEKNKLINALINMLDENMNILRNRPSDQVDKILPQKERAIEKAPIPRQKITVSKKSNEIKSPEYFGIKTSTYTDSTDTKVQNPKEVDETKVEDRIFQGIEKMIDESTVPDRKKMDLKRKLKKLAAENLKKPFSEDVQENISNGIADIIDNLPIPNSEKNVLKSVLTDVVSKNINNLHDALRKKSVQVSPLKNSEEEPLHNIFQEMERAIKNATIPRGKKKELKKKLEDLATKDFNQNTLEDIVEALKDGMFEIIHELELPKGKKNKLVSSFDTMIDENIDVLRGQTCESPKQDYYLKELEAKAQGNILQRFEKATNEPMFKEKKTSFKNNLQDTATKTFTKPLSQNVEEALKKEIKKSILQSDITDSKKSQLNLELLQMISGMLNEFEEGVDERLQHIFDKYGIKPTFYKTLADEFDKLLEVALKDEDFKTTRRQLITKFMRELKLSKEEARALADELIDKAIEMAQKEGVEDILKARKEPIKTENLKDQKKFIDDDNTPSDKKKDLKLLQKKEPAKDFGKTDEMANRSDDEILQRKERPLVSQYSNKITEFKEAFAKAINNAVDHSTVSNPDKNSLKNKLFNQLKQTTDNSTNKNDVEALKAEVVQEYDKIIDACSILADNKKAIKSLLQKELTKEFGDKIIDKPSSSLDDGESSNIDEEIAQQESPTAKEYEELIIENIKTWMGSLAMDFDPEVTTAIAEDLAGDILDRQKYLQAHPETISADNDEIENLKYQVFRRINNVVEPKNLPPVIERTGELYRIIMDIEPPADVSKLLQTKPRAEQSISERRRRDQSPPDGKRSTSATLPTENINYSLKELILRNKGVRKQWSKHLNDAITKLPLPKNERNDLEDKLAIYDETGQINILSALNSSKENANDLDGSKSSKQASPKPVLNSKGKASSTLSKIEEALTFSNITTQKSPFSPNSSQEADLRDFKRNLKDTINSWLKKARVEIEPKEKNRISEELTLDVVARHLYVQTFGETASESENLYYLKLQIHRRLYGMVSLEALKEIIENAEDLGAQIDNVGVPQLVVLPESEKPKTSQQNRKTVISQKSASPAQRKLGPADILGIRSRATNTATADGDPHTIVDEDGVEEESDTEFNPGQASTPSKPISGQQEMGEAEFYSKVTKSVTTWLESMPIDLEPEVKTGVIYELTTDIVDRQKYLKVHPDKKVSDDEEIENLKFQVFKRLDKVVDPESNVTPSLAKIEELYKMINGEGRRKSFTAKQAQEFQTALNEEISAILNNYQICCDKRELLPNIANELSKLRKHGADQDEIVENLIAILKPLAYLSDEDAEELAYKLFYRTKKLIATIRGDVSVKKKDFKEAMMKDTGDVFQGCPMSASKQRLLESQLAEGYARDLGIPLEDSNVTIDDTGPESKTTGYGMSFNGLSNFIDTWLRSIHTDDDSKNEDEIEDMNKEKMYYLMHKIGEMNVDPEIFNDDALYEAVLREELQHLFGDVKLDDKEFQALKEDLIEKVLETQHRAHDEIAGQNYKKNLRDTISKHLPDQRNLSKDDQATMETLKDQLADAYIDLHYSGNNESQREKLKRKISDEINTFCKDYLNRNPCSPLSSQKLNHNLYAALNKVPLPKSDSIKYEVEQARIREEINDWVKDLPLQPQSPTELLARNKLIYVLSKKLFDIEVEEQDDTENDSMRNEIVKFLNKLPLESEEDTETIADMLIDKLKTTEKSRKYNATSNVTIDAFGNVRAANTDSGTKSPVCLGYKWLFDKRKPCTPRKVYARHAAKRFQPFPPCTLSPEDRAHLEKIRRRTCPTPSCVTSLMRKKKYVLGAVSPPFDAGSQTELKPFGVEGNVQSRICPFAYEKIPRPCPRISANLTNPPCAQGKASLEMGKPQLSSVCPSAFEKKSRTCPGGPSKSSAQPGPQMRRHTISSGNISDCTEEEHPRIVNKNNWDPSDKNNMDDSELQQSEKSSRRQSDSAPCNLPGPCHPPRQAPCRPSPSTSPRQPPNTLPKLMPCSSPKPAPYKPAPCRPPPCQSPTPAPCNQSQPCFSRLTPAHCHRPSSGKRKQNTSPQSKSPRQNSSEHYTYLDPQSSFQRSSHRDIPCSRSSCAASPCMSSFGQYTPPGSPGFSKRFNECRMPKRDGLQDQMPSCSRPAQRERVIELGSLDDVSGTRPKKRHSDQSDWPKFHEDDHFWAAPMRRVILDEGIADSVIMERERREERVSCRCKERLVPKCSRVQPGNCPSQPFSQNTEDGQNLKRCSKCCGIHCPYPSFLYFRQ